MQENRYRRWLERQGRHIDKTIDLQVYRVKRVEEHYGCLEEARRAGRIESIRSDLRYSMDDKRNHRPNPSRIPFNGDIYNNLQSYRFALDEYERFLSAIANLPSARLSAADAFTGSMESQGYMPQPGDERRLIERQIRERRGQQPFREKLRRAYSDTCVVTGCKLIAVLEAAHIKPYRREEDNDPSNGLLLRADIHTLFDLNYLAIEPSQLIVELHPDVVHDEYYKDLDGKSVDFRGFEPSVPALKLRYDEFQAALEADAP